MHQRGGMAPWHPPHRLSQPRATAQTHDNTNSPHLTPQYNAVPPVCGARLIGEQPVSSCCPPACIDNNLSTPNPTPPQIRIPIPIFRSGPPPPRVKRTRHYFPELPHILKLGPQILNTPQLTPLLMLTHNNHPDI